MRKEPFTVGDFVHVYNRGNRKLPIVNDERDQWRFLAILRFFNDNRSSLNLLRRLFSSNKLLRSNLNGTDSFAWPTSWPKQEPLVEIISYVLMPNHYHLLLREIAPGGISAFMKKLGNGYTAYFNLKHGESGKIFQGSYQARVIGSLNYLQYIDAYIQVLNPLELPLDSDPISDFSRAFCQIIENPFSSLGESLGARDFSILNRQEFLKAGGLSAEKNEYLKFARTAILEKGLKKILCGIAIE